MPAVVCEMAGRERTRRLPTPFGTAWRLFLPGVTRTQISTRCRTIAVIERDQGLCQLCGASGVEIDHIDGNSPDLSNLRLLCRTCHRQVTEQNLVPATAEQVKEVQALWSRVKAARPSRLCDDEQRWASAWRGLLTDRKEWLWGLGDMAADEVCVDPSDYDGGFGPGSALPRHGQGRLNAGLSVPCSMFRGVICVRGWRKLLGFM